MEEYKKFAKEFAKKAGKIMRDGFVLGMARQRKEDNTPVTESDLRINKLLIEEVKARWPEHSVLGEEENNIKQGSEYVWVCDPIDGTIPYSHAIPICMFSLALVKNGKSILGVAYDPFGERLFFASQGEGAYLNDKKICVSKAADFKNVTADYEMWQRARFNINKLAEYFSMKEDVKLMKLNSFVYPSCLVAAGELAFTIFPHTTAHDGAAVKIIVQEAGGKVSDLFGKEQRYDRDIKGLIVSNGALHEKLVSLANKMINKARNNN